MPRYNVSRKKYPIVAPELRYTEEHQRRVRNMAQVEKVSQSEAIRRAIDYRYESLFLSKSSSERTSVSDEPNEAMR